jgi:hypothetical protein
MLQHSELLLFVTEATSWLQERTEFWKLEAKAIDP